YIFRILSILFICVLIYLVYIIFWIRNFNVEQSKAVENISVDLHQTFPIIRDPNGCFGVVATVNDQYTDTLLFDTQASTSLAKQEVLDRYEAEYWKRKPMPTFNFYKQVYFSKLYKVNDITLGNGKLEGVIFTSVPKDNGMYNALYRPVLGRAIMENIGWKFDLDSNEIVMFAPDNEQLLQHESKEFTLAKEGVNDLQLYSEQTDTLNVMFDLGSNYDIIIDKNVYETLLKRQTPRMYTNYRREGLTDTIAEFHDITVFCNGIAIPDCTLSYIPSIDRNVAGNIFAGKINFILANGDLYIKQRTDSALQVIQDGLPSLGLRLNVRNNTICVTALEINGPAEKAGLMLGDKVIAIDKGAIESDIMSVSSGRLESYIRQAKSLTLEIERNGERKIFVIMRKRISI
ncbi:PDZ domain-containing protein, partial [Phocaeicola barnesiae]|uniref:PDZ domain-containing protein n=1 Tax=Phocaeicola barnesiae TaxID=376804 RepID=UPI001F16853A